MHICRYISPTVRCFEHSGPGLTKIFFNGIVNCWRWCVIYVFIFLLCFSSLKTNICQKDFQDLFVVRFFVCLCIHMEYLQCRNASCFFIIYLFINLCLQSVFCKRGINAVAAGHRHSQWSIICVKPCHEVVIFLTKKL